MSSTDIAEGELIPCPFCSAGTTILEKTRYWTGKGYRTLDFTVMHWCKKGSAFGTQICIKEKNREQAIAAWNKRIEQEKDHD